MSSLNLLTPKRANERFAARVNKTDNGCWNWVGGKTVKGYGNFYFASGVYVLAHRWAWMEAHGPIPDSLFVCHRCDNRLCVRLDHLFLGTNLDNLADMVSKGRQAKGNKKWSCRLTEKQVYEIRALAGVSREIARDLGLPWSTVWSVWNRKTWNHLPERTV